MQRKLRWGILSTARIGLSTVIPALMAARNCDVVAIASRDGAKAESAAHELGIPRAHASYEALLADPDIDAIYNPLPNHLHVPMTVAAARAGKHVLCEKPMAMDAADAAALRDCPDDVIVMEAFMPRFHPQWHRARQIITAGTLGAVRAIEARFTYRNVDPDNVRNQAMIGGGGILDIGCYCLAAGRYFFDAEPLRVLSLVDRDPDFGTDRLASLIFDFGDGRRLSALCATQLVRSQHLEIIGEAARLELPVPFTPRAAQETRLIVDDGTGAPHTETLPPCNHYQRQAEAFADAALAGTRPDWGIEDAIAAATALGAAFESERVGGWVSIAQRDHA